MTCLVDPYPINSSRKATELLKTPDSSLSSSRSFSLFDEEEEDAEDSCGGAKKCDE